MSLLALYGALAVVWQNLRVQCTVAHWVNAVKRLGYGRRLGRDLNFGFGRSLYSDFKKNSLIVKCGLLPHLIYQGIFI